MKKSWGGKLVGLLVITVIGSCVNLSTVVNAEGKEMDTNVIVASDFTKEELENLISKNIDNVEAEVTEQYEFGMMLVNLKGKGDVASILSEIEKESGVEFAQQDYEVSCEVNLQETVPEDNYFDYQWGLHNYGQLIGGFGIEGVDINVLPAWKITEGSQDVVVGVLDSGVDINHEDLQGSIYVNQNEIPDNGIDDDANGYIDDVNGWDFLNDDNTVYDSVYGDLHGTYVAGIVAADKNNIGICGVAPNVQIMPLKFIDTSKGKTSDAIKAIQYAERMGVDIINCSWGGYNYNKALKKTMKNSKILFVCSSGNEANCTDEREFYPTCFNINNIITVGAIDNQGDMPNFSNYGSDVDVVAPGLNVIGTTPGNGYLIGSGTSFAAPYVTGIAALIKSVKQDSTYKEIKKAIVKHVVVEDGLQGKVNTSGRVDAYAALKYVMDKNKLH
jgi:subtilisin family serine protease